MLASNILNISNLEEFVKFSHLGSRVTTQATLISVGHLILYIVKPPSFDFVASIPKFDISDRLGTKTIKLFPIQSSNVAWSELEMMNEADFEYLKYYHQNYMRLIYRELNGE